MPRYAASSGGGLMALTRDADGVLYTPLGRLARGSFALPLLAYEHIDDRRRPVVLKRLPPRNRAFSRAFHHELTLGLTCGVHSNLVRCRRISRDEHGLFAVLGWVPGMSVAQLLGGASADDAALPLDVVLAIGRQLARALRHVHSVRTAHGSVQPSNVLLRLDGRVKLQLPDGPREPDVDALDGEETMFLPRWRLSAAANARGYDDSLAASVVGDLRATGELLCELTGLAVDNLAQLRRAAPTLAWTLERCLAHERDEQLRSAEELCWSLDAAREELGPADQSCLERYLARCKQDPRSAMSVA
jgi:hypothetical protein